MKLPAKEVSHVQLARDLLAVEAERKRLQDRVDTLEAAIKHVILDSPGTPDSVKKFLSGVLAGGVST